MRLRRRLEEEEEEEALVLSSLRQTTPHGYATKNSNKNSQISHTERGERGREQTMSGFDKESFSKCLSKYTVYLLTYYCTVHTSSSFMRVRKSENRDPVFQSNGAFDRSTLAVSLFGSSAEHFVGEFLNSVESKKRERDHKLNAHRVSSDHYDVTRSPDKLLGNSINTL